jgi:hypothetical protein
MEKRIHNVKVRMTDSEFRAMKKAVASTDLKQSVYLRHIIAGRVPQPKPPPEYEKVLKELRAIGNNLNQLAAVAHATGFIHADRYDELAARLRDTVIEIREAVELPRRAD